MYAALLAQSQRKILARVDRTRPHATDEQRHEFAALLAEMCLVRLS
jgi:hypothetical protein